MLAPYTYILPLATIQRSRLLAAEGSVLVDIGDRVTSNDVVAQARRSTQHLMLDAARALNVLPARVQEFMQRSLGEKVEKGSIIAGRRGIPSRLLRAPADGRIAAISSGQILLQVKDQSSQLPARIPGEIIDIQPNRGVVIRSVGAWIQAAWGNGSFDDGILEMLADRPDHSLTADEIDMSLRGVILVAGNCSQRQALELAAQVPIRGLVLASLATRLLPVAAGMPYPIILIEGFGEMAMNSLAYELFETLDGKEAAINAQQNDRHSGHRPEIIIPQEDAGIPPRPVDLQNFRLGQTVRILRAPHEGAIAEITALLPASTLFPSGLRALGAEVDLADGGETFVPLANLEVLG